MATRTGCEVSRQAADALVEQIVALKRDGLCDADIIAAIGVHQATFYRWPKEVGEVKTGVKRALYEEPRGKRRKGTRGRGGAGTVGTVRR